MLTMTTEEYTEKFEECFDAFLDSLRTLHNIKRAAYTGGRRPLENYEAAAATLTKMGARADRGCLTIMIGRLQEKVNRLASLVGMDDFFTAERDESFQDTCMDVAVISGLCVAERALLEASGLSLDDTLVQPNFKMNDEERAMFEAGSALEGCGSPRCRAGRDCEVVREREARTHESGDTLCCCLDCIQYRERGINFD